jgi:hypothetical protein
MPTLHLYRHILKAAKHFPSRKRDRIYEEIRREFRANAVRVIVPAMPKPARM